MGWFLYDNGLRHEGVNYYFAKPTLFQEILQVKTSQHGMIQQLQRYCCSVIKSQILKQKILYGRLQWNSICLKRDSVVSYLSINYGMIALSKSMKHSFSQTIFYMLNLTQCQPMEKILYFLCSSFLVNLCMDEVCPVNKPHQINVVNAWLEQS